MIPEIICECPEDGTKFTISGKQSLNISEYITIACRCGYIFCKGV